MHDAGRKFVAVVDRQQAGRPDKSLPQGNNYGLSRKVISVMRKAYEGRDDDTFDALKAAALETGEPIPRTASKSGARAVSPSAPAYLLHGYGAWWRKPAVRRRHG